MWRFYSQILPILNCLSLIFVFLLPRHFLFLFKQLDLYRMTLDRRIWRPWISSLFGQAYFFSHWHVIKQRRKVKSSQAHSPRKFFSPPPPMVNHHRRRLPTSVITHCDYCFNHHRTFTSQNQTDSWKKGRFSILGVLFLYGLFFCNTWGKLLCSRIYVLRYNQTCS